jgi:hypothetical protein
MRQALHAARIATPDERIQRKVLDRVATLLPGLPSSATPVDMGRQIYKAVSEITGSSDPYIEIKREYNDRALEIYPHLQGHIQASPDHLLTAVKLAALGNIIDFGANPKFDLDKSIEEGLAREFTDSDYPLLTQRLAEVEGVLYIGDNAGEIVFDRILVEQLNQLGKKVIFVVRGAPIINDATMDDAYYVGMDQVAEVITSGVDGPGTTLRFCRSEFIDVFRKADLLLAKGQGNFEGLSDEHAPLFFLLTAKCPVIAHELGVEVGALVLHAQAGLKRRQDDQR